MTGNADFCAENSGDGTDRGHCEFVANFISKQSVSTKIKVVVVYFSPIALYMGNFSTSDKEIILIKNIMPLANLYLPLNIPGFHCISINNSLFYVLEIFMGTYILLNY